MSITTYYAQPADLRAELGVDSSVLDDDAALKLIADAEDVVDSLLGAWPIQITTGRKIDPTLHGILSWQIGKLTRATVKIAALVHATPDIFTQRQYTSVSGPDFTVSGPVSGLLGTHVLAILDSSGLRRLTTRATPRIGSRGLGLLSEQVANGPDFIDDDR